LDLLPPLLSPLSNSCSFSSEKNRRNKYFEGTNHHRPSVDKLQGFKKKTVEIDQFFSGFGRVLIFNPVDFHQIRPTWSINLVKTGKKTDSVPTDFFSTTNLWNKIWCDTRRTMSLV
jgi:hypothetical protein